MPTGYFIQFVNLGHETLWPVLQSILDGDEMIGHTKLTELWGKNACVKNNGIGVAMGLPFRSIYCFRNYFFGDIL